MDFIWNAINELSSIQSIQHFMSLGGWVLWVIAAVAFLLLALVIERFSYLLFIFGKRQQFWIDNWQKRTESASWCAHRIRESMLSHADVVLTHNLAVIKMLVLICPLLGLLGTVSGMINVFDVMSHSGTANARMMASGVARATLPTMAGMIVAIIGLLVSAQIQRMISLRRYKLANALALK